VDHEGAEGLDGSVDASETTGAQGVPQVGASRMAAVQAAVARWRRALINLDGNNRLLYYRDLKVGTLDLLSSQGRGADAARHALLSGRSVRLSQLFAADIDDEETEATGEGVSLPGRRASPLEAAAKRARAIVSKAVENYEERGLETLFLAQGMASWVDDQTKAQPQAPVLLWPVEVKAVGGAAKDFSLRLGETPDVNPTLLHMLEHRYALRLDRAVLEERVEVPENGPLDTKPLYETLEEAAKEVAGFSITERLVVGNFSYAKQPMVDDLDAFEEELAAHDIVAAIAGDEEAREALRSGRADAQPQAPDTTPAADEYLVAPADASQNWAINAAVAGESVVIQGPPGTGKSQTITNLIAALSARGKSVLFVAEKRAAIEAVLERLDERGLADLVMDLHGGTASRKRISQGLGQALAGLRAQPAPDMDGLHRKVQRGRDHVLEHVEAMHELREPFGVSLYTLQGKALATPERARVNVSLPQDVITELTLSHMEEMADVAADAGQLRERATSPKLNPWAGATVSDHADAEAAYTAALALAGTWPSFEEAVHGVSNEAGFTVALPVGAWRNAIKTLLALAAVGTGYEKSVASLELESLSKALHPARRGALGRLWARLSDRPYREAVAAVRACRTPQGQARRGGRAALTCVTTLLDGQKLWQTGAGSGQPRALTAAQRCAEAWQKFSEALEALSAYVDIEELLAQPPTDTGAQVDALISDRGGLEVLLRYQAVRNQLEKAGLASLIVEIEEVGADEAIAPAMLWHVWALAVRERIAGSDPRVGRFHGAVHRRRVEEYRAADAEHIATTPQRVRYAVSRNAAEVRDRYPEEDALVGREVGKARRHLPIRDFFAQAPHVLTAIKPCWTMSPLLVSQLLPGKSPCFDVVIFDEASQVEPADAVPALLRGHQVVVAGDRYQLPPTPFFVSQASADLVEGEDEEGALADGALVEGFESVLDVLSSGILRDFWLRWHYRSHHEELIAFSNHHIYNRALTTFPGVGGIAPLTHRLVKPVSIQAKVKSAPEEVALLVDLVLQHAATRPEESLGVITLSLAHAQAVTEALRQRMAEWDGAAEFLTASGPDRFFVKNIETVQGDERDAIIFSLGHSKRPDGTLDYRIFGPLLRDGGERRLNVAVTRARASLTLVSCFSHDDMQAGRSSARGVELFREYLAYAASGGVDLGSAADAPVLNPFEIAVGEALERAGIPVVPQVGASGYRIDFAASHPVRRGEFVLAIECDGAAYHSSLTARDRDHLRQQVLEDRGWRFHRIWSSEWFAEPEGQVEAALDAYQAAVAFADARPVVADAREDGNHTTVSDERQARAVDRTSGLGESRADLSMARLRGPQPVEQGRGTIKAYSHAELKAMVRWVEKDTVARTKLEVVESVFSALGFRRRRQTIMDAIGAAVDDVRGQV
jgi:very-short-patch-repair endonuclease